MTWPKTSTEIALDDARAAAGASWYVWYIRPHMGPTTWHAMPAGATTAACDADQSRALLAEIKAYERNLPHYVAETRELLSATLSAEPARRDMLERRLEAQLRMSIHLGQAIPQVPACDAKGMRGR